MTEVHKDTEKVAVAPTGLSDTAPVNEVLRELLATVTPRSISTLSTLYFLPYPTSIFSINNYTHAQLKFTQTAKVLSTEEVGTGIDKAVWVDVQRLLTRLTDIAVKNVPVNNTEEEQRNSKVARKRIDYEHSLVQINAPKAEVDQRIAAFIQRKRNDINESNILEFCEPYKDSEDGWCSRTNPAPILRLSVRSHLKVSRVENLVGPNAQRTVPIGRPVSMEKPTYHQSNLVALPAGVEERLNNMERHVGTGGVPLSVYERLKKLEDRILELESCSPELFQVAVQHTSRRDTHPYRQGGKRPQAPYTQPPVGQ
eukprot:Ihof_evm4s654 gene=Ihof_evmTU4s654